MQHFLVLFSLIRRGVQRFSGRLSPPATQKTPMNLEDTHRRRFTKYLTPTDTYARFFGRECHEGVTRRTRIG